MEKQKKNRENIKNAVSAPEITDAKIAAQISTEVISDAMKTSQSERENISVEEVRELIYNIKRQELNVGEVIAQLDSLIKKYPALMDDSTTENIAVLLRMNLDIQENEKIKEVLKIG